MSILIKKSMLETLRYLNNIINNYIFIKYIKVKNNTHYYFYKVLWNQYDKKMYSSIMSNHTYPLVPAKLGY